MTLSKSKIFLILCLSFILGIWLGKYASYEIMAISAMIFIILITMFWSNRLAKVIGFAGLVLLLGSLRLQSVSDVPLLTDYYDQELEVQAVIVEEPDVRSAKVYLTLGKLVINGQSIDDKILITVPKHPEFEYGQTIIFTDKIVGPKDAEEKGEFSYKNYLSRFGISALTYYPQIELVDSANSGNKIKFYILSFKKTFLTGLAKILPEPQNSFLAGLLVGLRRGIPENLLEKFNITGTTHIIAISGFNITIIAQAVEKLLQGFGKRLALVTTTIVIALFVIMTGAPASVVRAGIMGILLLISLNSGRLYAVTNAMALTAVIMIGINPKILQFDIGFQLSFMALLGLVYLTPRIEPYFARIPKLVRVYLVATLAAQIFVLPLLLYNFDRLSLIAPITNIMILPVIPFAMLFGFLAGTMGLIWGVLGIPFAWVTWLLLTYIIRIVNLSSLIPLASVEITNTHIIFVVIYYVALVLWLTKDYIKWKPIQKKSFVS